MLVYFARGSVPWEEDETLTSEENAMRIREKMASLSAEDLCDGFLPHEFVQYINYVRNLGISEKPDYKYLRDLFRRRFRAEGFRYDHVFDWTERRFHEIRKAMGGEEASPVPARRSSRKRARDGRMK